MACWRSVTRKRQHANLHQGNHMKRVFDLFAVFLLFLLYDSALGPRPVT